MTFFLVLSTETHIDRQTLHSQTSSSSKPSSQLTSSMMPRSMEQMSPLASSSPITSPPEAEDDDIPSRGVYRVWYPACVPSSSSSIGQTAPGGLRSLPFCRPRPGMWLVAPRTPSLPSSLQTGSPEEVKTTRPNLASVALGPSRHEWASSRMRCNGSNSKRQKSEAYEANLVVQREEGRHVPVYQGARCLRVTVGLTYARHDASDELQTCFEIHLSAERDTILQGGKRAVGT